MKFEPFISKMMEMNVLGRLWHWSTDTAQHHITYEQFLTQNETLTDSFVESALGNDIKIDFAQVGVTASPDATYDLSAVKGVVRGYREQVVEVQSSLDGSGVSGKAELIALLDDVVELCSKSLYLLSLK